MDHPAGRQPPGEGALERMEQGSARFRGEPQAAGVRVPRLAARNAQMLVQRRRQGQTVREPTGITN